MNRQLSNSAIAAAVLPRWRDAARRSRLSRAKSIAGKKYLLEKQPEKASRK